MSGKSRQHIFLIAAFLIAFSGYSQHIGPQNGVYLPENTTYALTNCKIVVNPDFSIPLGMLVVRNGIIEYAGIMGIPPRESVKIDLDGFTIYPSFIDIYSSEGIPKPAAKSRGRSSQLESLKEGPYYWNEAVQPEVNAYALYSDDHFDSREAFIKQGFGAISVHNPDGVVRGTSVLVTLGDNPSADNVIRTQSASHYSFEKGASHQAYPSSQMGCIALLRQFFYDCIWYSELKNKKQENVSLEAGMFNKELPNIFLSQEKFEVLRIAKLANEFKLNYLVKGNGDEYERVNEIQATGARLILPLEFPKAFDVSDPYLSRFISLTELKAWEMKPYNPYILYKNRVKFAFTLSDLKDKKDFFKNIRKAIEHGLPEEEALRALTETPAKFIRCDSLLGTLEKGKIANFLVVKGSLFDPDSEIYENWMPGERRRLRDIEQPDIRGKYDLNISQIVYELEIKGSSDDPKASLTSYKFTSATSGTTKTDTIKTDVSLKLSGGQISMSFLLHDKNYDGLIQLNGAYNPKLAVFDGKALLPDGYWSDWNAIRSKKHASEKNKKEIEVDTSMANKMMWPSMAYGFDTLPKTGRYFIKNATLWTNEAEGIVRDGSLLIADGKIQSVNSGATSIGGAIVIDAKGKHVTCGIIDEHSHIAISRGVNEGGQAVSAEVSIGDVVNSDDINIYRQLAGGVTAAQLLHGSANPIGGQSALIKLRWGFSPDEMLIKNTDAFIKFALGENVKQSNWGDESVVRYPQTRMGVEQVFYSSFIHALEYKAEWKKYIEQPRSKRDSLDAPRRDLEAEILLEIIEDKRFITCHSYMQAEINMLMKMADSLGFRINTFTHILEGYKVADKMKAHGVGASSFADWWAYKFEVYDAIPYNPAILCKSGVVTAINSDDAEMGRRLNQEAAKAVKYGGVSEAEAWKMVTLNPAKLLHLDSTMGSLKAGKDADIVIWSDNPLSVRARVEKTFVDGMLLYDVNRSYRLNERDKLERKRIMQKMIEAKNSGEETRKPSLKAKPHYHCDTIGDGETDEHNEE